jgi:hypothetical protein
LWELLRVVWIQTTFGPAIHHKLPRILPTIPWFQLRYLLGKLRLEQFTSSQGSVIIDLMKICDSGDIYLLQGSIVLVDMGSMVQIHFRLLGFGCFKCETCKISWRKILEVNDLSPRVVTNEWSIFSSDIQVSGVSNVEHEKSLK